MKASHAFDAILKRKSVAPRKLAAPGPRFDEIERLAQAAAAAPDHGLLRPARLLLIQDKDRDELAKVFELAALELDQNISAEMLRRETERAHHAPTLIAIIARIQPDHAIVSAIDQWISVGASIQNILLTAEDLGFHAMIVSGKKVGTHALRHAFKLSVNEHFVGFIAIGTRDEIQKEVHRKIVEDTLEAWVPAEAYPV